MTKLNSLIKRNKKVFFRDKVAVFFSFLSMMVIIALYAMFLQKFHVDTVQAQLGWADKNVEWLINSWIMAGILVVNSVTIPLGFFTTFITDQEEKRFDSFLVAPISRAKLVLGYLITAIILSFSLTMISFVIMEVYIVGMGGEVLPLVGILKVTGFVFLSTVSGSAMIFFLISFLTSTRGYSALSTVVGTMVGFFAGVYVPIGYMPSSVQTFTKLLPTSHSAVMIRGVFMERPTGIVFGDMLEPLITEFDKTMGNVMVIGNQTISTPVMIAFVFLSGVFFIVLSSVILKKRRG